MWMCCLRFFQHLFLYDNQCMRMYRMYFCYVNHSCTTCSVLWLYSWVKSGLTSQVLWFLFHKMPWPNYAVVVKGLSVCAGGDQGILNSYFNTWATADISKHLPFIYNLSSIAIYSYLPAFKQWVLAQTFLYYIRWNIMPTLFIANLKVVKILLNTTGVWLVYIYKVVGKMYVYFLLLELILFSMVCTTILGGPG